METTSERKYTLAQLRSAWGAGAHSARRTNADESDAPLVDFHYSLQTDVHIHSTAGLAVATMLGAELCHSDAASFDLRGTLSFDMPTEEVIQHIERCAKTCNRLAGVIRRAMYYGHDESREMLAHSVVISLANTAMLCWNTCEQIRKRGIIPVTLDGMLDGSQMYALTSESTRSTLVLREA